MKQTLLSFNIFIDNEYLDKYIAICQLAKTPQYILQDFYQKHHIVPRSYFKLHSIPIDSTSNNVVKLNYCDHILCHYYLAKCTIGDFNYRMIRAFTYLTNRLVAANTCTEDDVKKIIPELEEMYFIDKHNESNKLKNGKWVNNGIRQLYISGLELETFLQTNQNFAIGKLPLTKEQRERRSMQIGHTKNKKVINNGSANKFVANYELDDYLAAGWLLGRYDVGNKSKLYGLVLSEEHKQKCSSSLLTKYADGSIVPWNKGLTKDTNSIIAQYSLANSGQFKKGERPWNYNKCFSEETKEKMRLAAINRPKRKVLCIELNIIFNSVKEASEFIGCSVASCCCGRNKTAGGYHWKYVEDEINKNDKK